MLSAYRRDSIRRALDTSPIRVISYNVRYFSQPLRGLASTRLAQRRIAARLAALQPACDVVCLQEVESCSLRSRTAGRAGEQRQFDQFLVELNRAFAAQGASSPYEGLYFPGHVTFLWDLPLTSSGLGILVNPHRFRISSHNAQLPWVISRGRIDPLRGPRICAHARLVDRSGRHLNVFNTHLSLPLPAPKLLFWRLPVRLGHAENQLDEGRAVTTLIRQRAGDEPFVLCGDFNASPGSPVHRHLIETAGFRAAQPSARAPSVASRPGPSPTFAAAGIRLHLDHLFCGGGAAWLDVEGTHPVNARASPFSGLSDHAPVIARLTVHRSQSG